MSKPVFITLDKEYELKFTHKVVKDFEAKTGKRLFDDIGCQSSTTNDQKLWAMLRQTEPNIKIEDVEKLVEEHSNELKIRLAIIAAINEAYTDKNPNA